MRHKAAVRTDARCTQRNQKLIAHRVVLDVVGISPCNGIDIACRKGKVVVTGLCPDLASLRRFRGEVEDATSRHRELSGRGRKKRR